MAGPKNQHIIPRCYLKQFVDPNTPANHEPYVWIFERGTRKGKRKAPKNILTGTDFYTLQLRGGDKDYTLEKTLSQIESEYAAVFDKKIRHRIPLDDYEHVVLCVFIAAMLQRTTKQKENIENFIDQVIERIEELEKSHGISPKTSREWKQGREDAHKISLIKSIPRVTEILTKMNVAFLCATNENSFITSDAPCVMFNSQLQWQRSYSPGLGQKHVELRMPLSPQVAVCFSWVNNVRGYLEIGKDRIHEINRSTFAYSHEYFIARSSRVKRRWFRRFPLDPIFMWRFVVNKTKQRIADLKLRRKYHV
jgi:hypothetical protein